MSRDASFRRALCSGVRVAGDRIWSRSIGRASRDSRARGPAAPGLRHEAWHIARDSRLPPAVELTAKSVTQLARFARRHPVPGWRRVEWRRSDALPGKGVHMVLVVLILAVLGTLSWRRSAGAGEWMMLDSPIAGGG